MPANCFFAETQLLRFLLKGDFSQCHERIAHGVIASLEVAVVHFIGFLAELKAQAIYPVIAGDRTNYGVVRRATA